MQAQTLQVGTQTIAFYESAGTGPAALFLHSNTASARSFRRQLEGPPGAAFRLVAMDLPGHGESPPPTDPQATYSPRGYADIVVGVAAQLGLTNAVFVGWSLGGHVLLEAADRLPGAAGLMIFGTPPLGIPPAMDQAFLPNPVVGIGFKQDLTEEEAAAYVSAFFRPGADVPAFCYEDARRTDGLARAYLASSVAAASYKDEVEIVARLSVPLAILHGEEEQLVNLTYLNSLTMPTLWRGAVQVIPGAGHAPHWEQPERFNALLEAFLHDTQG